MVIDSHAHIFPRKIATKAVENIGKFYDIPMYGTGDLDALIKNGNNAGVDKFIVCSTATAVHQVNQINEFIKISIEGLDNIWGLCTMHQDLTGEEIDGVIQFALDNNLIGIKLHPDFQKFNIDDKTVYKIYERAQGVLPILFHTGDSRYDFSSPIRLAKVAKEFPNLQCIGAHFGGYSRWSELECYKDLTNVYFDTSSSLFELPADKAVEIINFLGVDRFMFGVDYPMWSHAKEMENIDNLGFNESDKAKILYENAIRFYNLKVK